MQVYAFALATFVVGLIGGILFQRSGLCTVGGYRDFWLFRDTHLLRGAITFIIGAFIGYVILWLTKTIFATGTFPWVFYKGLSAIPGTILGANAEGLVPTLLVAIFGGFGVGFFSILAGGCPMRQFVMASEGNKSSIAYALGFALGIPITYAIIHALLT